MKGLIAWATGVSAACVACGGVANDTNRTPEPGNHGGAGGVSVGGASSAGGVSNGGVPTGGGAGGCLPVTETCNGIDDDCDGEIDEHASAPGATDGVDFASLENCGACNVSCTAETLQVIGVKCTNDPRMWETSGPGGCDYVSCALGYVDLDGIRSNGCEYHCPYDVLGHETDEGGAYCGVDDDCDGKVDEDLCADDACGGCDTSCAVPHRVGGCFVKGVGGVDCSLLHPYCTYLNCEDGWEDRNGIEADGCEAKLPPLVGPPPPVSPEVCDGFDNDADGQIDEAGSAPDGLDGTADPNDPTRHVGDACGSSAGACLKGVLTCVGGALDCTGDVEPRIELCNGVDDDCDGQVDEADAQPCGPTGFCAMAGSSFFCTQQCSTGEFPCPTGMTCVSQLRVSTNPDIVTLTDGCVPNHTPI